MICALQVHSTTRRVSFSLLRLRLYAVVDVHGVRGTWIDGVPELTTSTAVKPEVFEHDVIASDGVQTVGFVSAPRHRVGVTMRLRAKQRYKSFIRYRVVCVGLVTASCHVFNYNSRSTIIAYRSHDRARLSASRTVRACFRQLIVKNMIFFVTVLRRRVTETKIENSRVHAAYLHQVEWYLRVCGPATHTHTHTRSLSYNRACTHTHTTAHARDKCFDLIVYLL